jgi:hypothetical protein
MDDEGMPALSNPSSSETIESRRETIVINASKSILPRARLVACEESNQALGSQEAVDWIPGFLHFLGPHAR